MTKAYRRRILAAGTLLLLMQADAWAETKVEGTAEALRVETANSSIEEVLASLRDTLQFEYRTSIQLDQPISGSYRGSLQRVLSRVLDGYDFILKNSSEKTDLLVLGRHGSPELSQSPGNPDVTREQQASGKPVNEPNPAKGKSAAADTRTPQKAPPSTVPSMLTMLAQQQLPNAGRSPAASAQPNSASNNGNTGNTGNSAGSFPSQAEIAALTQQAASKLEALRISLQRVGAR
jgi:hypothetical protein